ncbi:hypothetical protein XM38_049970 [Halomicronema hongdechloris C2206]|uniref:SLH domain-containing protein n=1 Tax=Halomicronema hongdechloris C2206 TaxID=1641165 RepID=A0A1Z3HUQ7_9CYAN|nr:iron uptake porin [Halomicronema hongdechloris]ASC74023.1 hypothetical protein XM38_049970 [Halomicronema hongdechloris C2206]
MKFTQLSTSGYVSQLGLLVGCCLVGLPDQSPAIGAEIIAVDSKTPTPQLGAEARARPAPSESVLTLANEPSLLTLEASAAGETASVPRPEESYELGQRTDAPLTLETTSPSVDGLSDVQPGDWAYEALRSLVEDYGCLMGFPDNTFRGNQALSRYEFAASLSACLDALTDRLTSGELDSADLTTVQRLRQSFADDLATLEADITALETDVSRLQTQQFSPTTRLFGQVIYGIQQRTPNRADFFPVDGIRDTDDPGDSLNMITNAQLSLFSRLTPRSFLLMGLQAGQGSTFPRLNNDVRLGFEGDTDFNLVVSDLTYRQLIGDRFALIAGARGVNPVNVFRGANRIESAGSGPLSALAQRNPIINIGRGDAGLGFDWQISDRISLQGVYAAADEADPQIGLFEGDTTLGFQLSLAPVDEIDLALHYINSFSNTGNLFTGNGDAQLTAGDATTTNAIGATLAWDVNPFLTLGTWGGYTRSVTPGEVGSVETINWMVFANFPDLFGEGHMGGIYVGQPPRISSSTLRQGQNIPDLLAGGLGDPDDQPGRTTHMELFYRYQMTPNISLTPGFIVIFNPAHTPDSETIGIAALRTTFTF